MLCVYGDESADENKQRVFAVSGVFGTNDQWKWLKDAWRARTGGKVFHATDCDSDKGDFADCEHQDNKSLYADLTRLIAASGVFGHAVVLDLISEHQYLPDLLPNSRYFRCFSEIVLTFGRLVKDSGSTETIKFRFDRNHEIEYNAAYFYDFVSRKKDWPGGDLFEDEISFVTRRDEGVQVADLIAREAMKGLDNQIGPVKRPQRKSLTALLETKRFNFVCYVNGWFKELAEELANPNSRLAKHGMGNSYIEWLSARSLPDTYSNRIRFFEWKDAREQNGGYETASRND
jgi:hypothetical protein